MAESYTGGPLNGLTITNLYDQYLRRTNLVLKSQNAYLLSTTYTYDNASRLWQVSDGVNSATYSYLANSPLVGQITFKQGQTVRMTTTKNYDYLNRLRFVGSTPGSGVGSGGPLLPAFTYTYNAANQRVRVNLADGSFWVYEYDSLGQVKSGKRYWGDWTPVAGQQFEYRFDAIGNRIESRSGGDQLGQNLRQASYYANLLNQYTSRDVPRYADIMGVALATATVTVTSPNALNNGQAVYRRGEYFRKELAYPSGTGHSALWEQVTVSATGEQSKSGYVFVPKTPEVFTYDLDGNLTSDGRWNYYWDGENRLVKVESRPDTPQTSWRRVEWQYDALGRRVRQTTSHWTNNTWQVKEDVKFVSDPMLFGRHIAELNFTNNTLVRTYVWGIDLSGSMDGAGGVGGLLWVNQHSDSSAGAHFCAYDGNGNVVALVSANTGTETARYEYGPFGEPIRITGPMSKENPFRFSTKRTCNTTDLVLYEYRAYSPSLGRWVSRDPIGDLLIRSGPLYLSSTRGGDWVFGFATVASREYALAANNGVNTYDIFGLFHDGGCGPGTDDSGHADFANVTVPERLAKCRFDYTLEDRGSSAPYPGLGVAGHFQDLPESEKQVEAAINTCDMDAFQRAMHRVQDYYTHFAKGYRWDPFNRNLPCNGFGHWCATPDPDRDAAAWNKAEEKTVYWLNRWLAECCVLARCSHAFGCKWVKRAQGPCDPESP